MHLKSLFNWFFSKITVILLLLGFFIAVQQSRISYKARQLELEADLFKISNEVIGLKDFKSSKYKNYQITQIASDGRVIYSSGFGSGALFANVEDFMFASQGQVFTRKIKKKGLKHIQLWSPYEYNGEKQVVCVDTIFEVSFLKILFSNLFINSVLAFLISFILSRALASPLEEVFNVLKKDVESITNETFNVSPQELEVAESSQLSSSIAELSQKVNEEYLRLRKDLSQWKVFFSTLPRGLLAIDGDRKIVNCNQNSLDMISLQYDSVEKSVGTTVMEAFRNADLNSVTRDFFDGSETLREYEFEQVVNDIVETFKIVCVELVLEDHENSTGALVIIENVTALRRLENMRKDFVANVSHELKTPIAIIGGFVETLKDCTDDPASSMRFLEIIEKNTARLTMVIDDLLSLSKLEQNEILIKKDFELRLIDETIRSAVDVCSYEAQKKDIDIIFELENTKDYKEGPLFANHRLLEQSIRNLVENAIRYSPEETKVWISSKKIDDQLEIRVKDSGPGIAEEHHSKIFERFYRVDKSRDRQTGGSGLGLSIVKHILRIHNGNVELISEVGQGSEFILTLPYLTNANQL